MIYLIVTSQSEEEMVFVPIEGDSYAETCHTSNSNFNCIMKDNAYIVSSGNTDSLDKKVEAH